jgi:DNA repair exonuclease SbcCD ATPase subunit
MMFLICVLGITTSQVIELEQENQELRISNEILHKQLMELSQLNEMASIIKEDYSYNKEKLDALLNEYSNEPEDYIKLTLSEQILYYMSIIHVDIIILGGVSDGVSAEDLEDSIKILANSIELFKANQQNREFNRAYNDLKVALDRKDESLKSLQLENAKLIGKLDNAFAELEQATQKFQYSSKKLNNLAQELEKTQKDQGTRLESLKASLQTQEQNSRTKEIEDFKKIQASQDDLILQLESKNSEQLLKIEQLSMEKVNLLSKLRLLNSTIERLGTEIQARDSQLRVSESKFEDFQRKIEYETSDEIASLRTSLE